MCLLCVYYVSIVCLLCVYYVSIMCLLCVYYVSIMCLLCVYYVSIVCLLFVYYVSIMCLLCISYVSIVRVATDTGNTGKTVHFHTRYWEVLDFFNLFHKISSFSLVDNSMIFRHLGLLNFNIFSNLGGR